MSDSCLPGSEQSIREENKKLVELDRYFHFEHDSFAIRGSGTDLTVK